MRISDWSSTCALPISLLVNNQEVAERGGDRNERPTRHDTTRRQAAGHPGRGRIAVPRTGIRARQRQCDRPAIGRLARDGVRFEIGRASCRESVWQYVSISVVAVSLKKTNYRVKPPPYKPI